MPKGSYFLAKVQADYERKLQEIRAEYEKLLAMERHCSRVFELDMVTITLGRMGYREKKFREFDRILNEVQTEFVNDVHEDTKTDPDAWYSKANLDREIKQYVGSMFVPCDQRYAWEGYVDGVD